MREFTIHDRFFGALGYLVIDTSFRGNSVGGVRILQDVTLSEISHMAKTQTRKYLFTGLPLGGAKAGLILGRKARMHRKEALLAFGRAIKAHIFNGFWPGCDMGSSVEDIRMILKGAGVPSFSAPIETERYTALGLASSIEAAMEFRGLNWNGCRIAIEGYGKVGSVLAEIAAQRGAKIVSISNTTGSISLPGGLDVGLMNRMRKESGNHFLERYRSAELAPKEKVFSADCDVFVPCARCWTVDERNASRIKARIVACGSNVPMTSGTERFLWEKGKTIVPDAVANCGGALGGNLRRFMNDAEIKKIFDGRFKERVSDIIGSDKPPSEYLDPFFNRRKKELHSEFSPKNKTRLDFLSDSFAFHVSDRIFGKGKLLERLFPH